MSLVPPATFLSTVSIFEHLPPDALALLASGIEVRDVPGGAVLLQQGEPGEGFFVIQHGILQVEVDSGAAGTHVVGRLAAGDVVGEMAMLHGTRRGATVRAVTSACVLGVSRALFDAVAASDPMTRERLRQAASRRLPSLHLATIPLFAGVDAESLRDFDDESSWVRLSGGETLFRAGDPPDDLYVVVRGRLEVAVGEGEDDVVTHLVTGDVVGEIGVLTGAPRNATVRAIRDTDLVRLSREQLHALLERHPRGAIEMLRTLAGRIRPVPRASAGVRVSTIAMVPTADEPLAPGCLRDLVTALADVAGPTLLLDAQALVQAFGAPAPSPLDEATRLRLTTWLHERESRYAHVVFDCGSLPAPWVTFALRQADLVMLVAAAGADPASVGPAAARVVGGNGVPPSTEQLLVLLHAPETAHPTGTARWLDRFRVPRHHHVRVDRPADYARLARFVARKAVGLAMSGGGARTMAHLGVVRAMDERGLPIDMIGGVSAGVLPASYCALGHDAATVERLCRENAGNYSILRDATLPVASFLAGKYLNVAIKKMYGEVCIEDLWLPYFCLAANLTTASLVVHDRGPLWLANRASMAVPGIEPPVSRDGELLVDGGVLNNLPVDIMRARCPGTVVAADVSLVGDLRSGRSSLTWASGWPELWARVRPFGRREPALPHVFEILARTATLSSIHHGGEAARAADIYVRTPTDGVATFDWQAGFTLVDVAHRLALDAIDTWRARTGGAR